MKCNNPNCDNDFEPKRSTAKYCSGACRKATQRVSGTKPALSVAKCPFKDVPVTEEQARLLVDIFGDDCTQHCTDPETLAIWERHKAQQRPTVYPDPAHKGVYV